jgi:prephenate dehydratase
MSPPDSTPAEKSAAESRPPAGAPALARVGYLGPEGTFTEEALLASAAPGAVMPVALRTIYDTIAALARGEVEWAVVPIENSLDGSVTVTLDLLAAGGIDGDGGGGGNGDVEMVGEALLSVRHSLIACAPVALSEIETVLTHPQVPGQCERFLRGELAHARVLAASSTAEAVRAVVAAGIREQAALGTSLAAEIYGGAVLREGVQDRDDNETRFAWLGRAGADKSTDRTGAGRKDGSPPLRGAGQGEGVEWKTSLVFWGPGAERAGWLVRCLDEFSRREINLTKIESRPRRERMGSYMFFVDTHGSAGDPVLAEAIAGLRGICEQVRVLGSYPRARPSRREGAAPPLHSAAADG